MSCPCCSPAPLVVCVDMVCVVGVAWRDGATDDGCGDGTTGSDDGSASDDRARWTAATYAGYGTSVRARMYGQTRTGTDRING